MTRFWIPWIPLVSFLSLLWSAVLSNAEETSADLPSSINHAKAAVPDDMKFEPPWRKTGDCGPVTLYVLMRLENRKVSVDEVGNVLRFDPERGCSLADMARAADVLDFPCENRFVKPNDLPNLPCPFILHMVSSLERGTGHFLVVVGFSAEKREYSVIDPVDEVCRWQTENSILLQFSGYVLLPKKNVFGTASSPLTGWTLVGLGGLLAVVAFVFYPTRKTSLRTSLGSRSGMTLLELLVVIAIIGTLIGLLLPAVMRAREAANRSACAENLRQLALAVQLYDHDFGHLPPGQIGPYENPVPGVPYYGWGPNSYGWSWLARVLPYVDQGPLFQTGGIPKTTLAQSNVAASRIIVFLCPSDTAYSAPPRIDTGNLIGFPVGNTNYKGVSGSNWGYDSSQDLWFPTFWPNEGANGSSDGLNHGDGAMFRTDVLSTRKLLGITDGLSNTFLIGEDIPALNNWCSWPYATHAYGTCAIPPNAVQQNGKPFDPNDWYNNHSFRSRHFGGLQFAFADGSVRFVTNAINLDLYRALATIQGGEAVDLSQLD